MLYDLSLLPDDIEALHHIQDSQSHISLPLLDGEEYLNLINQMES